MLKPLPATGGHRPYDTPNADGGTSQPGSSFYVPSTLILLAAACVLCKSKPLRRCLAELFYHMQATRYNVRCTIGKLKVKVISMKHKHTL